MLKEQLLAEAQTLDVPVELDSIFESVELSDEVKASFTTVFEQAVKSGAVKLAETHINVIADKADELVEAQVTERATAIETKLYEDVDKYFGHIASEWLAENKEAVSRDIKADLFESLVVGMKELFIEHNVVVPEEQVDIVSEMEEELAENQAEVKNLFETVQAKDKVINGMKRDQSISERTKELTESQVEKVQSLIEGLDYSDTFDSKLSAIVEMVSVKKDEKPVDESVNKDVPATKDGFVGGAEELTEAQKKSNQYIQAARALN